MPSSPEVEHLQRAVEAIKRALLPEKEKQPTRDLSPEELEDERERQRDVS